MELPLARLHLDNLIAQLCSPYGKEHMSIERRKVIVSFSDDGNPVYKFIQANNQDDMNVKIVRAFVESGRILQICPYIQVENHSESKILLKDYAMEWLERKRRLKETTRMTYLKYLKQYI